MEFRKAAASDVEDIMKIIKQAQAYFKENCVNQWQNNYPNNETIKNDIDKGYGYVLEDNGEIIGTVAVCFNGEKTYDIIYGGEWISSGEYAVIHRMAVDNAYKGAGLSSVIIKHIENICLDKGVHSIKIDTHSENTSMQRVIKKNNFEYCGIIYVEDKSSRLAFEKIF
jgi:RimJ/RimL family protein N-acetyltransferase